MTHDPSEPDHVASLEQAWCCQVAGRFADAEAIYAAILERRPDEPNALNHWGVLRQRQGEWAEAATLMRRSIEIAPEAGPFHHNLGTLLRVIGDASGAEAAFRQAVERGAGAAALNDLGIVLRDLGQWDEAMDCLLHAVRASPEIGVIHNNLGAVLKSIGWPDQAVACYRNALARDAADSTAHSNALLCEQYRPGHDAASLALLHAEWDDCHARPLAAAIPIARAGPVRGRRFGFVSADLGRHPVGYLVLRPLEALARRGIAMVFYSCRMREDDLSARFAKLGTWKRVGDFSDDALADQIRADGIDILFDLAGHTDGNRLPVFLRKPAALQISWAGYPSTTGLRAMDGILADEAQIPVGWEPHYRETILRVPRGFACFEPPAEAGAVGLLPALAAGHVTLGCLGNPAKVNPYVLRLWAQILRRLPDARLVLKFTGWDSHACRQRVADVMTGEGVWDRVEFQGGSSLADHLNCYRRIDIALDTLPYSGGITTCEALWMGVPVVTGPGATQASRLALSFLTMAGLDELVAASPSDYVERVVRLARDAGRLIQYRRELRPRLQESPLLDGERWADGVLEMLDEILMHRDYADVSGVRSAGSG